MAACSLPAVMESALGSDKHSETPCTAPVIEPQMRPQPLSGRQEANCLIDAAARLPATARVVDIRDRAEYSQLHIPGAVNQPLHSLRSANSGPLIVYDNGRFRSDALQLCERLSRYGVRDFKVIDGGIAAWAQSTRAQGVLDVSRLSDTEASAALVAGTSAVVTLSGSFPPVLRSHGIDVSAANPSSSGRTIVLAEPGTSHEQMAGRLVRRNGQNTTFYWTGSAGQLANLIGVHLAQDQRRRQGPMVNPNCPGL